MADPKYAHLSGIAYDQPDLYETSDLPEADQVRDAPDEESDSIERLTISAPNAFSKFKDKFLNASNVDFSDRLSRCRRTGYDARSGDWELVAAGEKETPLQRYQRLQCEMKELLDEVINIKEDSSKDTMPTITPAQVETMMKQLEELRLEKSLGTEVISSFSDPQGAQLKKLIAQLEKFGSGNRSTGETPGKLVSGGTEGEVRYQVNAKPSQAQFAQAARLADLEARVNRLSAVVVTSPSALRHLGPGSGERSLLEMAKWVAAKVNLLEPARLDAAEARASSVLAKLDQLNERSAAISGGPQNVDREKKIAELYELAKATEKISQVLPRALDRMTALEALHMQGIDFAKSLSELESLQSVLSGSCEASKQMLRSVEENFAANLVTMKSTIEGLDSRIKALAAKTKK